MAYFDLVGYVNSVGYAALPMHGGGAAVGRIVRQATPALNKERCFVCVVPGSAGGAEPAWVTDRGAKTFDGSITWQECTGAPAVNGDLANTPNWDVVKNQNVSLGQIIKRNNEVSYQICSVAGTTGHGGEPSFGDGVGTSTGDGTVVWVSLGLVGSFAKGGAPHARVANAGADPWFVGNSTIYVGDNHVEFQSTADIEFTTSLQNEFYIGKLLCHDHAGSYPPTELTAGAVVSCKTNIDWYAGGSFYVYGVTFKAGVGSTSTCVIYIRSQGGGNHQNWSSFDSCSFWLMSTAAFSYIYIGPYVYEIVVFNNTSVRFSGVQGAIIPKQCRLTWRNTVPLLAPGSLVPPTLIWSGGVSDNQYHVLFEACDLSQCSGQLVSNTYWWQGSIVLKDCKLHPAMSIDPAIGYTAATIEFQRCDSGAAVHRSDRYVYAGSDTTESDIIRIGGALDLAGRAQSRKLATNEAALWLRPLPGKPLALWLTARTATLTVHGLASTLPKNDEVWIEVEYLADPGSTLGATVTTSKATVLSLATVVSADDSMWANAPAGWVPFKLTAVVTPAHPGHIHVRPMVGTPRTVFYIDPLVVLS